MVKLNENYFIPGLLTGFRDLTGDTGSAVRPLSHLFSSSVYIVQYREPLAGAGLRLAFNFFNRLSLSLSAFFKNPFSINKQQFSKAISKFVSSTSSIT